MLGSQGLCTLIPAPETSSVDASRAEGFQLAVVQLGTKFHLNNSLGKLILYWFLSSAFLCLHCTAKRCPEAGRLLERSTSYLCFAEKRYSKAMRWFHNFLVQTHPAKWGQSHWWISFVQYEYKCYQIRTWQELWRITLQTVACEQCKNALLLLC